MYQNMSRERILVFFLFNISTKSEEKPLSSTCLLILQIKQPLPVLVQSYLSEVCPRGQTGSGSSPGGAQPELIISQWEQEEHVCNPVGLSAEQPVLSWLIDRREKLQAKPGHNRLKTGNHLPLSHWPLTLNYLLCAVRWILPIYFQQCI